MASLELTEIYAYKIVTDRRICTVVLIGSIRLTNVRDTFVIVGANFKFDTRLDIFLKSVVHAFCCDNYTEIPLSLVGFNNQQFRTLVKSVYQKINFLISHPKHMFWVLKRTVSMRPFFLAPKPYVKTDW